MNDLVNDLVDKLAALEGEIAAEKGDFALFAIVLREEAPDRWDLVVAAPWAAPERRRQSALADIVSQLKHRIRTDDLMRLSRIVFLKPTDRFVQAMNQAFSINHGRVEIKDSELFGVPVKHAYIVTSKRPGRVRGPSRARRRRSPTPH